MSNENETEIIRLDHFVYKQLGLNGQVMRYYVYGTADRPNLSQGLTIHNITLPSTSWKITKKEAIEFVRRIKEYYKQEEEKAKKEASEHRKRLIHLGYAKNEKF
jgi:hypothetical protein